MAEELNVKVTGVDLPPIEVKGTFTIPSIRIDGQNGKSAYEIWLEAGNSGTREDFLNSLKGKNGDDGRDGEAPSVDLAYSMLMANNVYCASKSIEDVIIGMISALGTTLPKKYKPLTFDEPALGQSYIDLKGEPHFKVQIKGTDTVREFQADNLRLALPAPFSADDVILTYINLINQEVGDIVVRGNQNVKTKISASEFENNSELVNIEYPDVTTIGNYAFKRCQNLQTANFPKAKTVGADAFYNCIKLQELRLPKATNFTGAIIGDAFQLRALDLSSYVAIPNDPVIGKIYYAKGQLIINEQSDADSLVKYLSNNSGVESVFNPDKSKKFNKNTKMWEKTEA